MPRADVSDYLHNTSTPTEAMTSLAHARQENAHLKQKLEALQLRASRTATAESRAAEANEPILQPNTERKCIFPIKHKEVWKMVRSPNPRTAVQTLGSGDVGFSNAGALPLPFNGRARAPPGPAAACAPCVMCIMRPAPATPRASRLANRTRAISHRPPAEIPPPPAR